MARLRNAAGPSEDGPGEDLRAGSKVSNSCSCSGICVPENQAGLSEDRPGDDIGDGTNSVQVRSLTELEFHYSQNSPWSSS